MPIYTHFGRCCGKKKKKRKKNNVHIPLSMRNKRISMFDRPLPTVFLLGVLLEFAYLGSAVRNGWIVVFSTAFACTSVVVVRAAVDKEKHQA